jgi:dTDP-4-amino-4,6-dideoxygalactose transaminase
VFAGMDLDTLNIDFDDAKKRVNKSTKAIMPVHLNGLPCNNIDEMREYCESKDIALIEDCAHSHGASIKGKKTGSFGNAGCFSFYATKVMTTGTGGMITTDDEELAAYARSVRHHGVGKDLEDIVRLGNKWLMPEINAVIGLHQLKKLDDFIRARNEIADIYRKGLAKLRIETINTPKDVVCSYYKFLCFLKNEKEKELMKSRLREKHGIEVSNGIYWPMCHTQPLYKGSASYPKAEAKLARSLCIPMYSSMKKEDAEYVLECFLQEIKRGA